MSQEQLAADAAAVACAQDVSLALDLIIHAFEDTVETGQLQVPYHATVCLVKRLIYARTTVRPTADFLPAAAGLCCRLAEPAHPRQKALGRQLHTCRQLGA